jgi:tripartite-type tricarboxylate transporter receptor subunit TctC
VPVINIADAAHIFVVPASLEAKDLAQFVAYAKANPGKVYYGSAGIGSPPHLSLELFARLADVKLMHVPYKGIGNALPDMLAPAVSRRCRSASARRCRTSSQARSGR